MMNVSLVRKREPEPSSERLRLEHRRDGQLWARRGVGEARAVRVVRCFPWSAPDRYLSLRDADDAEVAFVDDPKGLDAASRDALSLALAHVGFVLRITGIDSVEEEVEIRSWAVRTEQGPRRFQTARDVWPRELPDGGFLIRDVAGDLYYAPDPEGLDPSSRRYLWAFVD